MPSEKINLRYRPDIDALRGIAVVSVMLFHYGFNEIPGGFVGVDVFFVISGFLITGILEDKLSVGKFTFSGFYLRRARRLLPSFLIVVAACFIGSFIYLSPPHFERFSGALLYSLFSATNIFYIGEVGYFDTDAIFKPLLHTWSLSIEGQIYLVWPIFLFMTVSRRFLRLTGLFLIFAISLGGAVVFSDSDSSYYVTVFRFYEFLIGALTFVIMKRSIGGTVFHSTLYCIGAGLIIISFFYFDKDTPYPSFNALVPSIGTAFAIYSYPGSVFARGKVINNWLFVSIGKISYPLYLVHWPILVFYQYSVFRRVGNLEKLALLSLSILLGYILYRFVETTVRKTIYVSDHGVQFSNLYAKRAVAVMLIVFVLLLPALSLNASLNGGWEWRFSSADTERIARQLKISHDKRQEYYLANNLLPENLRTVGVDRVLIAGDSHARNLFNALSLNSELFPNVDIFTFLLDETCHEPRDKRTNQSIASRLIYGTRTYVAKPECKAQKEALLLSAYARQADTIIIASHWTTLNLRFVEATIDFYKKFSDARIVLYGSNQLPFDPPTLIFTKGHTEDVSRMMFQLDRSEQKIVNSTLREIALRMGVEYYDILSQICNDDLQECSIITPEGVVLYQNDSHWTWEGERYFGSMIANILVQQK